MTDDVRASREHLWQSYFASRRWTLATLVLYLLCLAAALALNILASPLRALWEWVRRCRQQGRSSSRGRGAGGA